MVHVDSYEYFQLAQYDPISYNDYARIEKVSSGKGDTVSNMNITCQLFLNDFLMTKQGDTVNVTKKAEFVIAEHFKHINRVSSKITESLGYTMIYDIIEPNQELRNIGNK